MILRDIGTSVEITLPNDMLWEDEFRWTPSLQATEYSLTGALIIQGGAKAKGRPITLKPPSDMAWVSRETVQALRDWLSPPDRKMRLILAYPTDIREFVVMFRHAEVPVEATPVLGFPSHGDDAWFNLTLRLMEVAL